MYAILALFWDKIYDGQIYIIKFATSIEGEMRVMKANGYQVMSLDFIYFSTIDRYS